MIMERVAVSEFGMLDWSYPQSSSGIVPACASACAFTLTTAGKRSLFVRHVRGRLQVSACVKMVGRELPKYSMRTRREHESFGLCNNWLISMRFPLARLDRELPDLPSRKDAGNCARRSRLASISPRSPARTYLGLSAYRAARFGARLNLPAK